MANKRWLGTATAVAQVKTIRFTTSEAGNAITLTATGEDGSTQTVNHTVADTVNNTTAAAVQAAAASSSNSLFQQITFTVSTDTVTATASLAGRPFTLAVSDNGNTAYTVTDVTANAGPHDFKTAANFSPSGVPVDQDFLQFTDGASDVLYGLDNNSVNLNQLVVTGGYRGNIGTASAPLKISTDGSGDPNSLDLGGTGFYYNFEGTYTAVNISGNQGTTKVKGNIGKTRIVGPSVRGSITIDATTTTNNDISMVGVGSSTLVTIPSTAVKTANLFIDSGRMELSASTVSGSKAILTGGSLVTKDSGKIDAGSTSHSPGAIAVFGGRYEHRSDQALAGGGRLLAVYGGEADFSKVTSTTSGTERLSIGAVDVFGGVLRVDAPGNVVEIGSTSLLLGGRVVNSTSTTLANAKG
jgi:hypothetical protein